MKIHTIIVQKHRNNNPRLHQLKHETKAKSKKKTHTQKNPKQPHKNDKHRKHNDFTKAVWQLMTAGEGFI